VHLLASAALRKMDETRKSQIQVFSSFLRGQKTEENLSHSSDEKRKLNSFSLFFWSSLWREASSRAFSNQIKTKIMRCEGPEHNETPEIHNLVDGFFFVHTTTNLEK
jgi:hypothetical protein